MHFLRTRDLASRSKIGANRSRTGPPGCRTNRTCLLRAGRQQRGWYSWASWAAAPPMLGTAGPCRTSLLQEHPSSGIDSAASMRMNQAPAAMLRVNLGDRGGSWPNRPLLRFFPKTSLQSPQIPSSRTRLWPPRVPRRRPRPAPGAVSDGHSLPPPAGGGRPRRRHPRTTVDEVDA